MRPIDADALIHAIRNRTADIIFRGHQTMLTGKDSCNPAEWTRGYEQGVMDTVNMIGSQNTIEAEPVRHGRWECEFETYGKLRCSVCKKEALLETANDALYATSNYCPNCGAKMRGDKNAT